MMFITQVSGLGSLANIIFLQTVIRKVGITSCLNQLFSANFSICWQDLHSFDVVHNIRNVVKNSYELSKCIIRVNIFKEG